VDRWLLAALALAAAFTLQGINWGRVECWNADEMALRPLFHKGKPPFEPSTFTKPPFDTYVNFVLVVAPVHVLEALNDRHWKPFRKHEDVSWNEAKLLGSRFLALALFLGSVSLAFSISREFFGLFAARVTALLFATSAGFIEFNHYLTADSPMLFWMLLSLFFSRRILVRNTLPDYLLAGLLTGLSTAAKYNALAIGIAIPAAHFLRLSINKASLLDRRLVYGVAMVPAGFVIGCPFAVLDWHKFAADFMYNYTVTPRYSGQTGHGYGAFIGIIPEILGWPGAVWIGVAVLISAIAGRGSKGFLLLAAVCMLYYVKIGSFARLETRFVLPVVPFLLLAAGPCLRFFEGKPLAIGITLAPVIVYNCIASFFVGVRFADDPRMAAQTWVRQHIPAGSSIESTDACPSWNKLPEVKVAEQSAPKSNERGALFAKIFGDNPWVSERLEEKEGHVNEDDFTEASLVKRNPAYIAVDSFAYEWTSDERVRAYYKDLVDGKYPYDVVFDLESPPFPNWVYPRNMDFLQNRIRILQKRTH